MSNVQITDSGFNWQALILTLIVLGIVACFGISLSIGYTTRPMVEAQATLLPTLAIPVTQTAVANWAMEKAEARDQTEKLNRAWVFGTWVLIVALVFLIGAGAGLGFTEVRNRVMLPPLKQIGEGVYMTLPKGATVPVLLDVYTGYHAPINDPAAVNTIRAALMERVLLTRRLTAASEKIAGATGQIPPVVYPE